jgi:hypothetical protein
MPPKFEVDSGHAGAQYQAADALVLTHVIEIIPNFLDFFAFVSLLVSMMTSGSC